MWWLCRGGAFLLLVIGGCGSTTTTSDAATRDAAEEAEIDASPVEAEVADAPEVADAASSGEVGLVPDTGVCADVTILHFTATPSTIERGSSTILSWSSSNARGCELRPDGQAFAGVASTRVTPTSTTEYALYCYGTACLFTNEGPLARLTVTVR